MKKKFLLMGGCVGITLLTAVIVVLLGLNALTWDSFSFLVFGLACVLVFLAGVVLVLWRISE